MGRSPDRGEAIGSTIRYQAQSSLIPDGYSLGSFAASWAPAVTDILRRYATMQVPRYTSYPTAAEFTSDVASADQQRWLSDLDAAEAVSVYLHVPYCRELCLYCGCNTKKAMRDDVIVVYRNALEREIALVSSILPATTPHCAAALGRRNAEHPGGIWPRVRYGCFA